MQNVERHIVAAVEDDPRVRESMESLMDPAGYAAVTFNAENGGHNDAVTGMIATPGRGQFHGSLWDVHGAAPLNAKNQNSNLNFCR